MPLTTFTANYRPSSSVVFPVAFIGAILKDTPNIVAPARVAGLTFLDEADAINRYVPELKKKGVRAIIAVIHQGGTQNGTVVSGDIASIVNRLDSAMWSSPGTPTPTSTAFLRMPGAKMYW